MEVAIIPARAGSKSIVNKNLQKIGGQDLVDRAILDSVMAKFFDEIILSTDIPTLLQDFEDDPRVTLHFREDEDAKDTSLMNSVVKDILEQKEYSDDRIWLIQPTSVFRQTSDFTKIRSLLDSGRGFRSCISVTNVCANHPSRMYTNNEFLRPIRYASFKNKQDLLPICIRSGHFYTFYASDFIEQDTFRIHPCYGYEIPVERAINIDSQHDLNVARMLNGTRAPIYK